MSNTNNDSSDIDKAAAQADSQKIADNLEETKEVNKPESLSEEEQTPFIEDDLRTDK
ncbi:hypothetical protein [Psychrobacter alimentarius]|uniref:hypothetical protein n=1 Tax=Psychrobacter alimentarius TaxID=261164 RepID=UPI003FCF70DC